MGAKRHYPAYAIIMLVVIIQLAVSAAGREYYLTQLTMAAYYSLVIVGLTVLMGYTGQVSMGHAAFFAIGGYSTALLSTYNFINYKNVPALRMLSAIGLVDFKGSSAGELLLSPWVSLAAAIALAVVIALLIGNPILKLKGHYLAMATLGFGLIIYRIVLGARLFGEADGISDVPAFSLPFGLKCSGNMARRVENYYLAWFFVITGTVLLSNLINSRIGRALRAIHGNEDAAAAMGVNIARKKLTIFVLSAVYAAVGGVFMTHFNGGIGPSEAGVMKSVRYVSIVAVGGMANLWGALAMGVILNYCSLRGFFGSYDDFFFGAVLIAMMLFAPEGILTRNNFIAFMTVLRKKCAFFFGVIKGTGRGRDDIEP